ncbi:hypothetical protein HGRIS_006913 [Hohenbuehelia grisea]|uniref:Uncharacterized protein n=1 Tax=Hohenbuehelia grisea TaxID=104357 RepID=A0ABR3JAG0_9AGAR
MTFSLKGLKLNFRLEWFRVTSTQGSASKGDYRYYIFPSTAAGTQECQDRQSLPRPRRNSTNLIRQPFPGARLELLSTREYDQGSLKTSQDPTIMVTLVPGKGCILGNLPAEPE